MYVLFAAPGFCNNDINYVSPDDRGKYDWLEAEVNVTKNLMVNCSYNPKSVASRTCIDHDTWGSPDETECITQSTSILQDISNVSTITIITKH